MSFDNFEKNAFNVNTVFVDLLEEEKAANFTVLGAILT